jgi:serine/threonine protein kinase
MPAVATVDDFLAVVCNSRLVDDTALGQHIQQLRAAGQLPANPAKLAQLLVRAGLLTRFQADQLLQGKWRGFSIGRYKVLDQIGAGGMGCVYLCEHEHMHRRVAVKVLPLTKAKDPVALERFHREAKAVAALDHPNIVRAYDVGQDNELHWLALEYVDGTSLQQLVRTSGPLSVSRAADYLRQAAEGLQHAYLSGLIHRDIKPGNLVLDRSGTIKLLDLGLARFFTDEEDDLTRRYGEIVIGTADYCSPEQAVDSHTVDIRADIYSLGATGYFLLTGHAPFEEASALAQKLLWHQTRQPRPIRQFRTDVPEQMAAVLDKMMAKDPAKRYQTPAEVVAALAPWTKGPGQPPLAILLPDSPAPPPWRRTVAALAGGLRRSLEVLGRWLAALFLLWWRAPLRLRLAIAGLLALLAALVLVIPGR